VEQIKTKLTDDQFQGQVKAKVVEVCKAEGCWIRVQKADGTSMMVRAKDHAFLMPENIVGRTVVIEGSAKVKEVSEEMRKHYAEDAGKSKKEIAKIKGSEKDVEFAATGVKVLD
jgi:bisphosphoglycerate-dependent phosphoglycerate mutase